MKVIDKKKIANPIPKSPLLCAGNVRRELATQACYPITPQPPVSTVYPVYPDWTSCLVSLASSSETWRYARRKSSPVRVMRKAARTMRLSLGRSPCTPIQPASSRMSLRSSSWSQKCWSRPGRRPALRWRGRGATGGSGGKGGVSGGRAAVSCAGSFRWLSTERSCSVFSEFFMVSTLSRVSNMS